MPFEERVPRDSSVTSSDWGHIIEVESDRMVGQNLGVNVHLSYFGPRQYDAACEDNNQPEGDRSAQSVSKRSCRGFEVPREEDSVSPYNSSGQPAGELMGRVNVNSIGIISVSLLDGSAQKYYAS